MSDHDHGQVSEAAQPPVVEKMRAALVEFTEWFEKCYPTGQSIRLPGARLYGIYVHAVGALELAPDPSVPTPSGEQGWCSQHGWHDGKVCILCRLDVSPTPPSGEQEQAQ